MSGLGAVDRAVPRARQPVVRVLHMAGGATFAAVLAVEAHAPAHRAALRPQVALQALLARQVAEVRRQVLGVPGRLELRHLRQEVDHAARGAGARREHRVGAALLLQRARLVVAVAQVPGRRAVQAGAQVLERVLVATAAGLVHDAQVHRVLEAAAREVRVERRHALVLAARHAARHVRRLLGGRRRVAAVAIDARQGRGRVHVLDARVASEAALRGRGALAGGEAGAVKRA